jgi:prepilin signal peptidase PulO-like enzyme (type II secretory pathway)
MQSVEDALVIGRVPPDVPAADRERVPAEPRALVRLGCGTAGVISAAGVTASIGLHLDVLAGVAFVLVLALIAIVDLEQMRVPNRIVVPAIVLALIWQVAFHRSDLAWCFGAGLGTGFFFGVAAVLTRGSIGMGDAKLAVLIGLVLGQDIVTALFLATLGGAVSAAIVLWRHGRAAGKTPMPYAPFLAAGAVLALLIGTSAPILH